MGEHDELIERLTEAEVREPRRPSGAYTTTLGAQAAAALRELQAERDALQRKLTDATNPALQEQIDRLKSNLSALEDEKNAYIDYVGDALQQQVDALQQRVHLVAGYDAMRTACQAALRALDTYEAMYRHHMTVQLYSARAGLREALGEWK